jgi:hypothetical protein
MIAKRIYQLPAQVFASGLLGMDFLSQVGALIDTQRSRIILGNEES